MKIEILGTGCAKCTVMAENAKTAISKIGGFHVVEKVEDIVNAKALPSNIPFS